MLLSSGLYNLCNPHKYYQYHVHFHVQDFLSKEITNIQSNCIIFFRECFEIPAFCAYVSTYVFISVKATSPHKGNLRVERIGHSGAQLFLYALLRLLVHAWAMTKKMCTS